VSDPQDPLSRLGQGVVQANLRLAKVIELLEARPRPAEGVEPEVVFDLIDALQLAAPHLSAEVAIGLRAARARAEESLARRRILPIPTEGPVHGLHHVVIEAVPTDDPSLHGTIARMHRLGWLRRQGEEQVLRTAHVSAFRYEVPR
jgi:hypothetical protein